MAFKMRGFSAFTKQEDEKTYYADPAHMDEIKLTDKYPSKKVKRKAEEKALKEKLKSNPVIQGVHKTTQPVAENILQAASFVPAIKGISTIGKGLLGLHKASKSFNLAKQTPSIYSKAKKGSKNVGYIIGDDLILQNIRKKGTK